MFNILYKNIDCLFITSEHEGGPASIPEALVTGTPIVTTQVGMVNDFSIDKGVVILTHILKSDKIFLRLLPKNIASMKNSFSNIQIDNLLTWKEVVTLYDREFFKFFNKNNYHFSIKHIVKILHYRIHTLYFKKHIKIFFISFFNTIRLLSRNL